MAQQTAVEWLIEQLKTGIDFNPLEKTGYSNAEEKLFEQAKQMEKDQIMKAVYDSMGTNFDPNWGRAELYYNETFGN